MLQLQNLHEEAPDRHSQHSIMSFCCYTVVKPHYNLFCLSINVMCDTGILKYRWWLYYSMQQSCNIQQQWYTHFSKFCVLTQVSVVPLSFSVTMACVSPPPFDVMGGLGDALMEVMRGTAVSSSTIWHLLQRNSCLAAITQLNQHYLLYFVQFSAKVEPSDAAMVSVSSPLAAAMEIKTALIAVMRLDVVSIWTIEGVGGWKYIPWRTGWWSDEIGCSKHLNYWGGEVWK